MHILIFLYNTYAIYVAAVLYNTICCEVLSILISSEAKNGIHSFCEPNIYYCCEHIVLFLRNMFKFFGHSQFLEICATLKEVVLFHDNDFILLRFACGFNSSSSYSSWHDVMVD